MFNHGFILYRLTYIIARPWIIQKKVRVGAGVVQTQLQSFRDVFRLFTTTYGCTAYLVPQLKILLESLENARETLLKEQVLASKRDQQNVINSWNQFKFCFLVLRVFREQPKIARPSLISRRSKHAPVTHWLRSWRVRKTPTTARSWLPSRAVL